MNWWQSVAPDSLQERLETRLLVPLLVLFLISGALSYVLLPLWARQSPAEQQRSQKKVAGVLAITGVLLGGVVWSMPSLCAGI